MRKPGHELYPNQAGKYRGSSSLRNYITRNEEGIRRAKCLSIQRRLTSGNQTPRALNKDRSKTSSKLKISCCLITSTHFVYFLRFPWIYRGVTCLHLSMPRKANPEKMCNDTVLWILRKNAYLELAKSLFIGRPLRKHGSTIRVTQKVTGTTKSGNPLVTILVLRFPQLPCYLCLLLG